MTQICVFNTRLFSLHNTLNYVIHGACLRMVLLTDVYRNLTSLWIKPRERAFKQFKSPVLNVLSMNSCDTMGDVTRHRLLSTENNKYAPRYDENLSSGWGYVEK